MGIDGEKDVVRVQVSSIGRRSRMSRGGRMVKRVSA